MAFSDTRLTGALLALLVVSALAALARADDKRGSVQDLERAWLSRDDRLLVVVTASDPLRGFDRQRLETRRLRRGRTETLHRRPLLPPDRVAGYARTGDLELYLQDVSEALRAELQRRLRSGWQPLVELDLDGQTVDLLGNPVAVDTRAEGARAIVSLVDRSGDRRVEVAAEDRRQVKLSHDRVAGLVIDHVSTVQVTADDRWLVVTTRTNVPRHAEVAPEQRLHAILLRRVLRVLRLRPDQET